MNRLLRSLAGPPLLALVLGGMPAPGTAAPSLLDCQMANMHELTGRVRVSVDLAAGSIQVTQLSAESVFQIFEASEQWIRGADGDFRIIINRQTGLLVIGKVGDSPFAVNGRCPSAAVRLL